MTDLPSSARVVIVGGGIVGCSVAYHLGKLGWTDVLLLEQGRLTSGSTWHAAGLVGQLRTSANITQLLGYSVELYGRLEAETGQATGWKRNGGLRLACTPERWIEVRRQATTAHSFGLEMQLLTPQRGAGAVAADDRSTTWSAPPSCRPTGRPTRPTSPRPWPRARAWPGVTLREGVAVTGFELELGTLRAVHHRPGPDRLREGRALRRPVDPGAGGTGRRQRAAGLGAAPVHRHRADRRA